MQKKNIKADKAEKMYRSGASMADIGRQLDIPAGTIRRWKNIYKWDSKPKANETERKPNESEHIKDISEAEKERRKKLGQAASKATTAAAIAVKEAKDRAAKRIAAKPPAYTDPELFAWRLAEYIYQQDQEHRPYLINGMERAVGLSAETWGDYASGSRDAYTKDMIDAEGRTIESREGSNATIARDSYRQKAELFPYMYIVCTATTPAWGNISINDIKALEGRYYYSDLIKNSRLLLNESVEERLINGRLGDVVRANNILGWAQEKREVHRMEIATEDDAKKALEELKLLDD